MRTIMNPFESNVAKGLLGTGALLATLALAACSASASSSGETAAEPTSPQSSRPATEQIYTVT